MPVEYPPPQLMQAYLHWFEVVGLTPIYVLSGLKARQD